MSSKETKKPGENSGVIWNRQRESDVYEGYGQKNVSWENILGWHRPVELMVINLCKSRSSSFVPSTSDYHPTQLWAQIEQFKLNSKPSKEQKFLEGTEIRVSGRNCKAQGIYT